jgi:hypothetical protein
VFGGLRIDISSSTEFYSFVQIKLQYKLAAVFQVIIAYFALIYVRQFTEKGALIGHMREVDDQHCTSGVRCQQMPFCSPSPMIATKVSLPHSPIHSFLTRYEQQVPTMALWSSNIKTTTEKAYLAIAQAWIWPISIILSDCSWSGWRTKISQACF